MSHPSRLPWASLRLPSPTTTAAQGLALLRLWLRRARTRHELAGLTPRQLRDAGLSAAMVRREAAKPFWEA